MDNKYGRLYTKHDMLAFAHIVAGSGIDLANAEGIERMLDEFEGRFPNEEPLFLLRGQDKRALPCIRNYRTMLAYIERQRPDPGLLAGVNAVVTQFEDFLNTYPERMKEPD